MLLIIDIGNDSLAFEVLAIQTSGAWLTGGLDWWFSRGNLVVVKDLSLSE